MSLKEEIREKLGIRVKLKAGMPGSMDIYVDDEQIYSKAKTGKMPRYADIIAAIQQRQNF